MYIDPLIRWSVGRLVRRSVTHVLYERHMYSASGFRITAPAQLHVTDALVYTAPSTAPAPHITAPAQPHATDAVMTALLDVSSHLYKRMCLSACWSFRQSISRSVRNPFMETCKIRPSIGPSVSLSIHNRFGKT